MVSEKGVTAFWGYLGNPCGIYMAPGCPQDRYQIFSAWLSVITFNLAEATMEAGKPPQILQNLFKIHSTYFEFESKWARNRACGASWSIREASLATSWLQDATKIDSERISLGFGLHFGRRNPSKIHEKTWHVFVPVSECVFDGISMDWTSLLRHFWRTLV